MRYKTTIAVVAFAAGYILRSAFAPSTPSELLSSLEKKISENPSKYEMVIDQAREFSHLMKAKANPGDTKQGYVPFGDLRLDLKVEDDGNLTVLVNNYTSEEQPVKYVNNKTAVGTYQERLESVSYETVQKSQDFLSGVKKVSKETIERIIKLGEKLKAMNENSDEKKIERIKNYLRRIFSWRNF